MAKQVMTNPMNDTFPNGVQAGERATWPHVSRIRTMCKLEFALERAVRYVLQPPDLNYICFDLFYS